MAGLVTILRTGTSQYTLVTGNSNSTYQVTVSNLTGSITHTWSIVDNSNVTISFNIDGIYNITTNNNGIFFNTNVPITFGGPGIEETNFTQLSTYLAPNYTGTTIKLDLSIKNGSTVTPIVVNYTIQSSDTTSVILAQNISKFINSLGNSHLWSNSSNGILKVYTDYVFNSTVSETINIVLNQNLWSTTNLFKCIKKLTNKLLCSVKGKCHEWSKKMKFERNELNKILLLYGGFNNMNDDERWDYLNMPQNTDLFNDIFNKLNIITLRCGECCGEGREHHRTWRNDPLLEKEEPFSNERWADVPNEPCVNCGEGAKDQERHRCHKKLPAETITVTGLTNNVTLIS